MILHWTSFARSSPVLFLSGGGVLTLFGLQTGRALRQEIWPPGDAGIVFRHTLEILRSGRYPERLNQGNVHDVFPYPPPSAGLFALLAQLGTNGFVIVWLCLMMLGLFAAFRFAVTYEDKATQRAFIALLLPAIAISSNPVVYDLPNLNNNLILLVLRWPRLR